MAPVHETMQSHVSDSNYLVEFISKQSNLQKNELILLSSHKFSKISDVNYGVAGTRVVKISWIGTYVVNF